MKGDDLVQKVDSFFQWNFSCWLDAILCKNVVISPRWLDGGSLGFMIYLYDLVCFWMNLLEGLLVILCMRCQLWIIGFAVMKHGRISGKDWKKDSWPRYTQMHLSDFFWSNIRQQNWYGLTNGYNGWKLIDFTGMVNSTKRPTSNLQYIAPNGKLLFNTLFLSLLYHDYLLLVNKR
jgi:hypothetical protein